MQRIAAYVLALSAVALFTGCKEKNEGMALGSGQSASLAYEEPTTDYYGPGSLNPPGGTGEYDVYTPADARTTTNNTTAYNTVPAYNSGSAYNSGTVAMSAPAPTPAAFSGSAGGRRHTVTKGDTLYSLARAYYGGNMSRWRDIYSANRNTLRDPNRLRVGQELIIP